MKLPLIALLFSMAVSTDAGATQIESLYDQQRQRTVPVSLTLPQEPTSCSREKPCPVAFISAGYGVPHQEYQFISRLLSSQGYLSVAIRHELKSDPPLSVSGNLYQTRQENWQRGAATLQFVRTQLAKTMIHYDFDQVLLVGHSNGGDLSALLINQGADFVTGLITLDHRRVPLPRDRSISVFSIRASDFPADQGVLYTNQEQNLYNRCVITIPNAKHNDMTDNGPEWLKGTIAKLLTGYLQQSSCKQLSSLVTP
ncbi:alpha/beta hydrolase [Pseudoalteromonas luteoviolacea]|nr:alpha/beta hydrolase [Pseudoalteromonas luteoviolacea]